MSDRRATLLWNLTKLPKILMEALTCLWRKLNNAAVGRDASCITVCGVNARKDLQI